MSEEKAKDTPEYWGAYYKGIEMLYDPRVTTTGVGGVSVINDIFNGAFLLFRKNFSVLWVFL
ncbi:hypothetical protein CPIN18021_1589 [Campylobacter pinnipediorum subsp. caledonicus]|uniref:Uncharacterized protein n=1 Tax=Campylobacter pinnipediorum subsp. caledonicus TaxID=1874362 RepID=A0A1S6U9M6_9BACT|nr:hypothetical protein [Campylobacter pinnipediorum]AQW86721.1 hypothetical protein CPIN18020_1539 [Campylobacter pinnipediorum subsp. caledonicus]AQW88372.1 hypothetical protein CPIN18021_1589 [Campylobacter pinnipediorum subsp. caledonicus]OPA72660.1 hypothetical protein BB381_05565 [Campylobacter pinnipediorum subsp. caledonicus]